MYSGNLYQGDEHIKYIVPKKPLEDGESQTAHTAFVQAESH